MKMAEERAAIERKVIAVATDTVADWGLDLSSPITADTKLMEDLNFGSIDIVQFAVGIERAFDRKGLRFETLLEIVRPAVERSAMISGPRHLHGETTAHTHTTPSQANVEQS